MPIEAPPLGISAHTPVGTRTGRTPHATKSLTHRATEATSLAHLARAPSLSRARVPDGAHGSRGTERTRVERRSGV